MPACGLQLLVNHCCQWLVISYGCGNLSEEASPPIFPGERILVSLVRSRGAESGVSLSPLCLVRASCLSLVNLVPGVPGSQREGGLVAETTEVHQTEPWHSTQKPLVHCPFTLKSLCHLPAYLYSPWTTPLSRLNLFGGIWEPLAPELKPLCLEDV